MAHSESLTIVPKEVIKTWEALAPAGSSKEHKLAALQVAARHHEAINSIKTMIRGSSPTRPTSS